MTAITTPTPTHTVPAPALLRDLVAVHVVATPDAVAVEFGDRSWTWREWADRIDQHRAALLRAGLGHGDRIAILDQVNPAIIELLVAASSLGIVTASLNWRLGDDELAYVLGDCRPSLVFVGDAVSAGARRVVPALEFVERTVVIGGDSDELEAWLADPTEVVEPERAGAPDDDVMLIYSSGTTGRPKGVLAPQSALVGHAVHVAPVNPFEPGDVNFIVAPLFHVAGISLVFWGIHAGVKQIFSSEMTVQALLAAIARGTTHAFVVAPVIIGLVGAPDPVKAAVGTLKYLGYGASPLPAPVIKRAVETWPDVNLIQVYGQTEVTGVATAMLWDDHRAGGDSPVLESAGRPVPGVEVKVVDRDGETELPVGEQGELWIRSDYAMSGYLNLPEATRETLVDGWVRTGDIGHIDAEGNVYISDRLKDLIISGGENIYSPEVEIVLHQHPAVVEAAVIGVPDDYWGEAVKAVVVTSAPVTEAELIDFCRERLARYKCPRTIDFIDELPRNPAGKVLKRVLRSPHWPAKERTS